MNRDILGFLFLVLAIVLSVLFLSPKIQDVRSITIDKEAKEDLTAARTARVDALKQIQATFAQQPDKIKKLAAVLPSEPQVPEILVTVEAMSREASIGISSIVPQVNEDEGAVFVTLSGEGSLPAVENFTKLIADNARPMSVPSISFVKTQDGRAISFNLMIRAPYNNPQTLTEVLEEEEAL